MTDPTEPGIHAPRCSHERHTAERIISEPVIAAIAAVAARRVPGVVRLETTVGGLLRHWRHQAGGRWTGVQPAPTAGVTVGHTPDALTVDVHVAVSADRRATVVAAAVQREVATAVAVATGLAVATVGVSILAVEVD